jgi:XTP/dITP diphosphohydrolase
MEITYVTGNKYKIELAERILSPLGVKVLQKKIYCPEIQDNKIENVSKFSAKYAANQLNVPVIKNDSGLMIDALKGFPGPYTAYVEDTLTEDGILKLMTNIENRDACFIEVISYCEPNCEPISFISKTEGTISLEKRGEFGWSYDRIFIPKGQSKTLAEFSDDERWKFWTDDAYLQLKTYLENITK